MPKVKEYTLSETAKKLNISINKVRQYIKDEQLQQTGISPVRISSKSLKKFKAKNRELIPIDGKTEVVNTHLGQVRWVVDKQGYLGADIAMILGICNCNNIFIATGRANVLRVADKDCISHGLIKNGKGYPVCTLEDISQYLPYCRSDINKALLLKELESGAVKVKEDAFVRNTYEVKTEDDTVGDTTNNAKGNTTDNTEIQVLDERELFGKQFKIYGTYEKPLFLAKDVAEMIGHSNTSKMVSDAELDDSEKVIGICELTNSYTSSKARKTQEVLFLTESGLYEVLMQSRKPIAKEFKSKIKEILRTIRMTGGYIAPNQEEKFVENYFNGLPRETKDAMINVIRERNTALENKKQELKNEIYKIEIDQHDNYVAINEILNK